MDAQYDREGEGGIGGYYKRILEGGEKQLEEAIRRGGLAAVKSRAIVGVLKRIREKVGEEGELSLEWLRDLVSSFSSPVQEQTLDERTMVTRPFVAVE